MINYVHNQNLLLTPSHHYKVITVNTEGVMGKGLAFAASEMFPKLQFVYREALSNGGLDVNQPRAVASDGHLFILFATKKNWRDKSAPIWIIDGMKNLVEIISDWPPITIHMPPLGCGLGGLFWSDVHDDIRNPFYKVEHKHELVLYL